jgi:hypothetical protein
MLAARAWIAHALVLATFHVRAARGAIARTGADRHALAGNGVLRLIGWAGNRGAFAGAVAQIEGLSRWTRFTRAVLIAADLVGTATQSIRLSIADITETGVRVRWSTLTLRDAQVLAADLPTSAIKRLALPTQARLAAATDMAAAAAVGVIRLGIDTVIAAICLISIALAVPIDTGVSVGTGVTTGTTVIRIGREPDALLVAARFTSDTATGTLLALFQKLPAGNVALHLARQLLEARCGAAEESTGYRTSLRTRGEKLIHLALADTRVASLSSVGQHGFDRCPDDRPQYPAEHTLEHLTTRGGRAEHAR